MSNRIFRSLIALFSVCALFWAGLPQLRPAVMAEENSGRTGIPTISSNPFEAIASSGSAPTLDGVVPEPVEGFLPVCYSKSSSEKVVALTIDDCNEAGNLKTILNAISKAGGTATLFPIGENVSFLASILRDAVQRGFEIENHTLSHSGLYHESDEGLARQIWQQNHEVSKALGENYQMHFLRPRGGDNRYDQRTHAYMRQMGYRGIAYWTQDGSHSSAKEIMKKLTPGEIILFHTTDEDVKIILDLIPRLTAKGYRMVTLNQLYNLDDNPRGGPVSEDVVLPLAPYIRFNQTLQPNDYLHDVYLMQAKLSELGYLQSTYNGFFGNTTAKALKAFQTDAGLTPDGVCGSDTWNALFAGSVLK